MSSHMVGEVKARFSKSGWDVGLSPALQTSETGFSGGATNTSKAKGFFLPRGATNKSSCNCTGFRREEPLDHPSRCSPNFARSQFPFVGQTAAMVQCVAVSPHMPEVP